MQQFKNFKLNFHIFNTGNGVFENILFVTLGDLFKRITFEDSPSFEDYKILFKSFFLYNFKKRNKINQFEIIRKKCFKSIKFLIRKLKVLNF